MDIKDNNSVHDMERLIKLSVDSLIADVNKARKSKKPKKKSNKKKKRKKSTKSDYFDTFDVPVKSNLIKVDDVESKYDRFNGGDKDPLATPLEKDYRKRPPSAGEMGSSLVGGGLSGGGDVTGAGWGASQFGTLGFGESLNNQKSKFIEYVNSIYDVNDVDSVDILLSNVIKGYKVLFDDLESKSTAIVMGMQPSFAKYFNHILDDYVFALNNFMGDIVCVYLGESNGFETVDDMKDWYEYIGVDADVINRIAFIEKSTPKNDYSMIDCEFNGKSDQLDTIDDILHLATVPNNIILVGCFDLYFAFDFMLCLSKLSKKFEVDNRFSFMVE